MEATADSLRAVFIQEADEALATMEQALLALETTPEAAEPLNEVFRLAHTLKGGAAMVEYQAVADYAHKFEDALMMMRDGLVPVTPARVTVMLQVVDTLRELLGAQQRGDVNRLRAADLSLIGRLIPVEQQPAGMNDALNDGTHDGVNAGTNAVSATKTQSLRINMSKLDGMLTLSGEIAVAKGRLQLSLDSGAAGEGALSAAEELGRLLTTLHERVMELRLVQVGPLFRTHLRTVRDVAASQGKLLRLVLEGEEVDVDAAIVEQLRVAQMNTVKILKATDPLFAEAARKSVAASSFRPAELDGKKVKQVVQLPYRFTAKR